VEIALNNMLSLDLGYRYFRTAKARFDNSWDQTSSFRLDSHNASVGLRFKF
jgi:opacity protein-like surface antigen